MMPSAPIADDLHPPADTDPPPARPPMPPPPATTTVLTPGDRPVGAPRTAIVLGPERSGTTMVATMLAALGVFMGQAPDGMAQDRAITPLLWDPDHHRGALERMIADRNRRHAVWGLKLAGVIQPRAYALMRAPHAVVVLRDPLAIAQRLMVSERVSVRSALARAQADVARHVAYALETPLPCLAVSYERAHADPDRLAADLCEFLGLEPDLNALDRAARSYAPRNPDYLRDSMIGPVQANVDTVEPVVSGWARRTDGADHPVVVVVEIDGEPIARGPADGFRPDLVAAFGTDGRHAFSVAIPDRFRDGLVHTVRVHVPDAPRAHIRNGRRKVTLHRPT